MKPLLIYPEGSNDYRLWRMLNTRTHVTKRQYTEVFERYILMALFARSSADEILQDIHDSGRTILLVGRMAQRAFNLPLILIHPQSAHGCVWRQIPNVLSSWYDSDENTMLVEMLLEELFVRHQREVLSDVD